ncbi:MAG TPA: ABC transporter permease [Bacteroidales bacterium]|jgi:phospholipid/cholesterol/gamma-HCH transport system permease protein|nr:ABC transporter permease [Bacteroidales bacterium]
MKMLSELGRYFILMQRVFSRPEKWKMYYRQIIREIDSLGINSIGIVIIISIFMGAVVTLQTRYNLENPLIPLYLIGLTARDTMLLEFSSTIVGLILAGKVGSNIASEIGHMRITEQIDALEVMGINSACYLILPKVIAAVIFNPLLTLLSMFVGVFGGWLASVTTGALSSADYIYGIQYWFVPFYVSYSLIKTVVFAIIITTVPAYYGYHVKGGALEVGHSSTKGVVASSVLILLFNVILTQLLLA